MVFFSRILQVQPAEKMADIFEYVVDHVFLPKRIKGSYASNHQKIDGTILTHLLAVFKDIAFTNHLPASTHHLFKTLMELHFEEQMDESIIASKIQSLAPGQMIGLFIREQNCGISIYKMPLIHGAKRIVSTFHASIPNEVVTSNCSDIQVIEL